MRLGFLIYDNLSQEIIVSELESAFCCYAILPIIIIAFWSGTSTFFGSIPRDIYYKRFIRNYNKFIWKI